MSNQKQQRNRSDFQSGNAQTEQPAHQAKQVDFLMGRERQKDLVTLTAAILSNQRAYPEIYQVEVLVNMAENILLEIEKRAK